jgi:hypothetical protein
MRRHLISVLVSLLVINAQAQVYITGSVNDEIGEQLPLAHVVAMPDSITTTTDVQGFFKIRLAPGKKRIQVSFVGYKIHEASFDLRQDTVLNVTLRAEASQLKEVVVSGQRNYQEENFDANRTSTYVLSQDDVNAIPVLGGEADVIKTLQLLPGTVKGVEGTSDLFVRGGAADQNLVLLDGAPVYNTSHLFGFLSVFNPDVLEKVEAINGGFPAHLGGRLSSVLDVQSKTNLASQTRLSGDIGLIASRLYLEQPLVKNKASFWVAARRTYIDQVVKAAGEDLPYFFYDLNAKVILRPSRNDHIELSYYGGEDILDWFRDRNNDGDGFSTTFESGNTTQSLRWKRFGSAQWSSDLSLFRTTYKYDIRNSFEENQLVALSNIEDYGGRFSISYDSLSRNGILKAGMDWTSHKVSPNIINTAGSVSEWFQSSTSSGRRAHEAAAFAEYEWSPVDKLRVNAGFRVSAGFVSGKRYLFPEPRLSLRYESSDNGAIKLSYSRMAQYVHRISNSAVTSPTDIWYPVTDSIAPQSSHQVAVAFQKRITSGGLYLSSELYYKTMSDLIGYEEGTNLFLNTDFESRLIQGRGRAYGFEFLVRKETGRVTGWLSYTLSWAWRQFDALNGGEWFPARYDRRHNGAMVIQYAFNKRWSASAVWEYISGARFTPVIGQYAMLAPSLTGVDLIPVYAEINQVKLANTHRLDVGLKFRSKPGKRFQWQWFAGVYNVYNRANPVGINIVQDESDGSLLYQQPGLFGLLPFISYGFRI